jgi:hypothetical protein
VIPNENLPGPFTLLKEAIRRVPATKYALAVGGTIAVIAIVVGGFRLNLWVAALGAVVMLVLMTVFVIFASLAVQHRDTLRTPIIVFTWFCLLLMMATASVIFSSAFWRWPLNFGLLSSDSPQASLLSRIDHLEQRQPVVPPNSWTDYVSDYGTLASIALQYLHYIEGNPGADSGNRILDRLQKAFEKVKGRNTQKQTQYFEKPPESDYHSNTLPVSFDNLLHKIREDNKDGLSQENEACYEAAIRRWIVDAWLDDGATRKLLDDSGFAGSTPTLSPYCRARLPGLP